MANIENVMEHLAHEIGMDPLEFRLKNMIQMGTTKKPTEQTEQTGTDSVVNLP